MVACDCVDEQSKCFKYTRLHGLWKVSSCVMGTRPRVWELFYFTLPGCWISSNNILTHLNTVQATKIWSVV
jgi:hypothetical protein